MLKFQQDDPSFHAIQNGTLVRRHVSAKELTTFGVGGVVDSLIDVQNIDALRRILSFLSVRGLSWRVLGAGSNVVIPDQADDSVVLRLGRGFSKYFPVKGEIQTEEELSLLEKGILNEEERAGLEEGAAVSLLAFGATSLMALSKKTAEKGLSGLEFAAGIPASLGGAVVMNAGAHGDSMEDVIQRVFLLDQEGKFKSYSKSELSFAYRRSGIEKDSIVIAALLQFRVGKEMEIKAKRSKAYEYRKLTQPLHLPSAGSVFRNPIHQSEVAAAKLLEEVGVKGLTKNGVSFSEMHANWLVRILEEGSASDVSLLIDRGRELVFKRFGIELEPEIVLW